MNYPCPCCQQMVLWDTQNEYRPFCSARCKNNDLVAWATGEHVMASSPVEEEYE